MKGLGKLAYQALALCQSELRIYCVVGFYEGMEKLKLPPTFIKTNNTHNFSSCSDEGLKLEISAFQVFQSCKSTFINSFDKTKFLFHSPSNAVPQFH